MQIKTVCYYLSPLSPAEQEHVQMRLQGAGGNTGDDVYVHDLDCGDGFTSVQVKIYHIVHFNMSIIPRYSSLKKKIRDFQPRWRHR